MTLDARVPEDPTAGARPEALGAAVPQEAASTINMAAKKKNKKDRKKRIARELNRKPECNVNTDAGYERGECHYCVNLRREQRDLDSDDDILVQCPPELMERLQRMMMCSPYAQDPDDMLVIQALLSTARRRRWPAVEPSIIDEGATSSAASDLTISASVLHE